MKKFIVLFSLCFASLTQAQFLSDNTQLNTQSVTRWMQSNRDFAEVMQILDGMNATDEAQKKFDALPAAEQDQKIENFLQQKKLLASANNIATQHGWKSVGEYMRLSTKLGNAIAAYFFAGEIAGLTEKQKNAVRKKTDPAVLAVPETDVAFVKAKESLLKAYIQAYAKGR